MKSKTIGVKRTTEKNNAKNTRNLKNFSFNPLLSTIEKESQNIEVGTPLNGGIQVKKLQEYLYYPQKLIELDIEGEACIHFKDGKLVVTGDEIFVLFINSRLKLFKEKEASFKDISDLKINVSFIIERSFKKFIDNDFFVSDKGYFLQLQGQKDTHKGNHSMAVVDLVPIFKAIFMKPDKKRELEKFKVGLKHSLLE